MKNINFYKQKHKDLESRERAKTAVPDPQSYKPIVQ